MYIVDNQTFVINNQITNCQIKNNNKNKTFFLLRDRKNSNKLARTFENFFNALLFQTIWAICQHSTIYNKLNIIIMDVYYLFKLFNFIKKLFKLFFSTLLMSNNILQPLIVLQIHKIWCINFQQIVYLYK